MEWHVFVELLVNFITIWFFILVLSTYDYKIACKKDILVTLWELKIKKKQSLIDIPKTQRRAKNIAKKKAA